MGPLEQQRIALLVIAGCAAVAGLGAYMRAESGASSGYLLETVAMLVAVFAAAWRARLAGILILLDPKAVRRRAILSLLAGICAALVGCIAVSTIETDRYDSALRALAETAIVGGLGLGLAGFFSLAWAFGMGYAGERIERMGEEDW
jgi:hypothetical protein